MGVVLYRKGTGTKCNGVDCESKVFPPEYMESNLAAGWYLDPREIDAIVAAPTTTKEIRQQAKLAGFKDWRNAKIADLRERLGYED